MYQALYRKWRPQTFDEVVGQRHITETLKNQVMSGRLSHAYIFIGTRGTGKTTCARILAKAVNCEHPVNGNPCGVCAACRGIADGSVLDIVELDAASNNSVDNVRALREEAVFSPASVKKRVYIIDEVHMLSMSAFNALLKILEEPPEHLMFILATTELQKVPATILSRCQRHQFHRLDVPEIAQYLRFVAEKEQFGLTEDAAELIARMADGGLRDALSLLDQCSAVPEIDVDAVYACVGLAGNRRIAKMLEHILAHDASAALADFGGLWMDGKDPASFLTELNGLLRDLLMISVAPVGGVRLISGSYDMATLKDLASRMTAAELISAIDTVRRSIDSMRDARSPRTAAELCLVSLCDNTLGEDIKTLCARISRLEELAEGGELSPARGREYRVSDSGHGEPRFEDEDEIDPEDFAEEQPEDAFLLRDRGDAAAEPLPGASGASYGKAPPEAPAKRAEAPAAPAPPPETVPAPAVMAGDGEFWGELCAAAARLLPMEVRLSLNDDSRVRGELRGGVLRIEAAPGFMYSRLNRSDVLKVFSDAASKLLGKSVNAVLAELQAAAAARDINELKQFPETRFE